MGISIFESKSLLVISEISTMVVIFVALSILYTFINICVCVCICMLLVPHYETAIFRRLEDGYCY